MEQVVEALSKIGEPAIPVLIEALEDPRVTVRWGAVRALGRIGSVATEAIPALAASLKDESVQVRWAAARSLWAIGPAAATATPMLVEALGDKDWVVRWSAARALGAVAADSDIDSIVGSLAAALRDRDSRVCEAAAFALEQLGAAARSALPELSMAATWAGGNETGDTPVCQVIDVGPAIEEVLMETGWTVRWASVRALGVVGRGREDALPSLMAALNDEEWQVRGVATLAIGQFGDDTPGATVTAVAQNLKDEHVAVRKAAAVALGELGPSARGELDGLRAAERDEDAGVRKSASESIRKIMGLQEGDTE
jgi:HEAT repeat protein